jgi:hypothetical protein
MNAWIASFLPVGSAYIRLAQTRRRKYFSRASFTLTRAFSLDPEPDAKRHMYLALARAAKSAFDKIN